MAESRIVIRVRPGGSHSRVGGSYGPDGHLVLALHSCEGKEGRGRAMHDDAGA